MTPPILPTLCDEIDTAHQLARTTDPTAMPAALARVQTLQHSARGYFRHRAVTGPAAAAWQATPGFSDLPR